MDEILHQVIQRIAEKVGRDKNRLMDVVHEVQAKFGYVSLEAMNLIARALNTSRIHVEGVVSFYSFFSPKEKGAHIVRLSQCPSCRGQDGEQVEQELIRLLGVSQGETTADGRITLQQTACIGLCDQGPAAMVNNQLVAGLSLARVKEFVHLLKTSSAVENDLAAYAPRDNLQKKGPILFPSSADNYAGVGLEKALSLPPDEVIAQIVESRLRGRGGAGFPTGTKWKFARAALGEKKYVICNADEGEPGTFKDRVLLHLCPDLLFQGMTIAAYAIGASEGILYLRGEYAGYLAEKLEKTMEVMRQKRLLGREICGKDFHFDIRLQIGAGAYICGEESALLSSCEGKRGVPKTRPPFPVEKGYLDYPTCVTNVETCCCAAKIMEKGASWFTSFGTKESSGTKLFSVSGDCRLPGIYELPLGISVIEFLKEVGGENAQAVLVGGPSGQFVAPADFEKRICFEGLATGGSMVVFGPQRDLLAEVARYMEFFQEESCGFCVPCRVGNVLLHKKLKEILEGKGVTDDLTYLERLCVSVKKMSRCGLGQTSPNPIQSTLASFRSLYEQRLVTTRQVMHPTFDPNAALADAIQAQKRAPVEKLVHPKDGEATK